MNTKHLECAIKSNPCMRKLVRGVYASDLLPENMYVYPSAYIFNTDTSEMPGQHWIVAMCTTVNECEFYDTFGRSPLSFNIYISNFVDKCIYNDIPVQKKYNATCGYHVLYYLLMKCIENKTLSEIVHFLNKQDNPDIYVYEYVRSHFACSI